MKKIILFSILVIAVLISGCETAEVPEKTSEKVVEELPEEVVEEIVEEEPEIEGVKVEWSDEGYGVWVRTIPGCENILDYVCVENCYENIEIELPFEVGLMNVWEECDWDTAEERETDTGVEVLCFSQGCVPQADCNMVCPSG